MNVTLQWSKGASPVLSIYNETNHPVKQVDLTTFADDKQKLDEMMLENGFRKRTEEEMEMLMQQKREQQERNRNAAERRRNQRIEEQKEKLRKRAEEEGRPLRDGEEDIIRVIDKGSPPRKVEL